RGARRRHRARGRRSRRPLPFHGSFPDVTPVLVFDIETVPDADGIRRVLSFGPELSDSSVVEFAMQRRRQASGNDFLPPHLQRVVAISCALRSNDGFRVWSLGTPADAEREIVQRFFDGIE